MTFSTKMRIVFCRQNFQHPGRWCDGGVAGRRTVPVLPHTALHCTLEMYAGWFMAGELRIRRIPDQPANAIALSQGHRIIRHTSYMGVWRNKTTTCIYCLQHERFVFCQKDHGLWGFDTVHWRIYKCLTGHVSPGQLVSSSEHGRI